MTETTSPVNSIWLYEGIWGFLTKVFCVPRGAPLLPSIESEEILSRKPSPAFISYLKFHFWLSMLFLFALSAGLLISLILNTDSLWVYLVIVPILASLSTLFVIGYLTIHLRYDTTWYVFSDRSLRLRRGIWVIHESTITFENIQNVKVSQGPLQRFFGIANVVVQTAGGGGSSAESGASSSMHSGLIEGVAEAAQIRDSIMNRVRRHQSTGLGDEKNHSPQVKTCWSAEHIAVLREIRDLTNRVGS